jgi:RHS repeat-associated protein
MLHDAIGNRTSITANIPGVPQYSGLTTYQYSTKDEITQEQSARNGGYTSNFGYDGAGNATTWKGAAKVFNANTQDTAQTWDLNGNPTVYGGVALTWDPENQLTSVGALMTAGYTAEGLRAWKQPGGGARTYFLHDQIAPVIEMDAAGAVTSVNTWGTNGLVSRRSGGASVFYSFDPQGSVAQRLDAGANVLTSMMFDAHGVGHATAATSDPYGYKAQRGYYRDVETGLLLLTHRFMDVSAGRFLNRDPIASAGGVNLYGYVRNRPTLLGDPDGLLPSGREDGNGNIIYRPGPYPIVNPVPGGNPSWGPTGPGNPYAPTYPGHEGVDIFAPGGTVVRAAVGGRVIQVGSGGRGGNRLWIQDAWGHCWYYAHLRDRSVGEGAYVAAGDQIGTVGNTGAPGRPPHLHIGIGRRPGVSTGGMNWGDWHYPWPILGPVVR